MYYSLPPSQTPWEGIYGQSYRIYGKWRQSVWNKHLIGPAHKKEEWEIKLNLSGLSCQAEVPERQKILTEKGIQVVVLFKCIYLSLCAN